MTFPYNLTLTIPDQATYNRLLARYGNDYQAKLDDGTDNPQTQAQFALQNLKNFIKNDVVNWERSQLTPDSFSIS